jgi:hypothetical protein
MAPGGFGQSPTFLSSSTPPTPALASMPSSVLHSPNAGVVELVDAPDSKSGSVRSVGSIPTARTS